MTSIMTKPTSRTSWWEATKTVGVGLLLALGVHTYVAQLRSIPSESMVPTLEVGDRLIVEKLSYDFHLPHRGDIVVFKAPPALVEQSLKGDLIKRIIAVPGDVVAVKEGQVYVNGTAVPEPYVAESAEYGYGPVTVPEDQYFVLGDNRNHSYDSHFWGFVPRKDIIGRAVFRLAPISQVGPIF